MIKLKFIITIIKNIIFLKNKYINKFNLYKTIKEANNHKGNFFFVKTKKYA